MSIDEAVKTAAKGKVAEIIQVGSGSITGTKMEEARHRIGGQKLAVLDSLVDFVLTSDRIVTAVSTSPIPPSSLRTAAMKAVAQLQGELEKDWCISLGDSNAAKFELRALLTTTREIISEHSGKATSVQPR